MVRSLTASLVMLATLGAFYALTPNATAEETQAPACTVELNLEGMVCAGGCPPVIKEQLERVRGVLSATVTYKTKMASVSVTSLLCDKVSARKLVGAVKSPFRASFKRVVRPERAPKK